MTSRRTKLSTMASSAGIAAIAVSLLFANMATTQVGALLPADKVGVAGSNMETTPLMTNTAGTNSGDVVLLSSTLKTSNPEDLIIMHTQECSLLTDVTLKSNTGSNAVQTSTSFAQEKVWVEIDGKPVAVSNMSPDDGSVVFCDRTYSVSTNILNQIQLLCGQQINNTCTESNFTSYIQTKSAHAFNWVALNVGAGQHTIQVKAHLTVNISGSGQSSVAIGKRTLVVIPTHLANNAVI